MRDSICVTFLAVDAGLTCPVVHWILRQLQWGSIITIVFLGLNLPGRCEAALWRHIRRLYQYMCVQLFIRIFACSRLCAVVANTNISRDRPCVRCFVWPAGVCVQS